MHNPPAVTCRYLTARAWKEKVDWYQTLLSDHVRKKRQKPHFNGLPKKCNAVGGRANEPKFRLLRETFHKVFYIRNLLVNWLFAQKSGGTQVSSIVSFEEPNSVTFTEKPWISRGSRWHEARKASNYGDLYTVFFRTPPPSVYYLRFWGNRNSAKIWYQVILDCRYLKRISCVSLHRG